MYSTHPRFKPEFLRDQVATTPPTSRLIRYKGQCFDRLISLGRHCQTAYQIRRFTGDRTAFYFDWIGTPFSGLMYVLKNNFRDSFDLGNLRVVENGTAVIDEVSGFLYRHCFSRDPVSNRITQNAVVKEYSRQRQKFDFLISRLRTAMSSDRVLFVRQDTISLTEAEALYDQLSSMSKGMPVSLLLVQPPNHHLPTSHPNILVTSGPMLPSGASDWKGDDDVWNEVLMGDIELSTSVDFHTSFISKNEAGSSRNTMGCQTIIPIATQHIPPPGKRILVVPLPELGHILPTLKLASWLIQCGCQVHYLTSLQFRPVIEECGASVIPLGDGVMEGQMVSGQHIRSRLTWIPGFENMHEWLTHRFHDTVGSDAIDLLLMDCRIASQVRLNEIVDSDYLLLFATSLPNWDMDPGLDIVAPTLIFCPQEFEVPKFRANNRKHCYYVEPSLRPLNKDASQKSPYTNRTPIVLVTFGTQSVRDRSHETKLQLIARVAQMRRDLNFIVVSDRFDLCHSETRALNNLTVYPYVSQRELLKEVSVVITHGGLGTIKESIAAGIPMIVLPALFDQPFNAMRVRFHGLGEAIFPEYQTADLLERLLMQALAGNYADKIARMQKIFLNRDANPLSHQYLCRILNADSPSKAILDLTS